MDSMILLGDHYFPELIVVGLFIWIASMYLVSMHFARRMGMIVGFLLILFAVGANIYHQNQFEYKAYHTLVTQFRTKEHLTSEAVYFRGAEIYKVKNGEQVQIVASDGNEYDVFIRLDGVILKVSKVVS